MRVPFVFFFLAALVSPGWGDYVTKPLPKSFGVWEGWGTSLAWWGKAFGDRDDLADAFFTLHSTVTINKTFSVPGLGLNIVRYNAGATSSKPAGGSTMVRSPHVKDSRLVEAFWLTWEGDESTQWDWSRDRNQRMSLRKAADRGANLLQLFSNSPVWWMCDNHNPSGSPSGVTDNLQAWNRRNHTKYLANIVHKFRTMYNITFNSVEPFNEPNSNWWKSDGTQEGCHFSPATQAPVLAYMRQELDEFGLYEVDIAASDENSYSLAISTWNDFDAATKSKVDQVNVHGYEYGSGRRDILYNITQGKRLWNSEYGEGDASGMSLATNLNLDFKWLHPTAWVYWQAVDGSTWGLLSGNEDAAPWPTLATTPNNKYFVLAQYTRHIRPGMTIIDGGSDKNTVAAWDHEASRLVLVTTNYGTPQRVKYDLSQIYRGKCPKEAQRWSTTGDSKKQYAEEQNVVVSETCEVDIIVSTNEVTTLELQP